VRGVPAHRAICLKEQYMNRLISRASAVALAIACSLPAFAQTTGGGTGGGGTTAQTNSDRNDDDGFDPGWLGLLGLIGLAGLKRRDTHYDTRTGVGTTTGR
jgi:hypothetical protein